MEMKGFSIPAGGVFGVNVRIHLTFFFLLIFIWMKEWEVYGSAAMDRGLAIIGMIFISVALHEVAHALISLQCGRPLRSILLLPVGGIALLENTPSTRKSEDLGQEIRIAAAGPATNLFLAAGALIIVHAVAPDMRIGQAPLVHLGNLARSFIWINIFLATF